MTPQATMRLGFLAAALALLPGLLGQASQIVTVVQSGRAFSLREVRLKLGDVLRFSNEDVFLHQVYVASPGFNFMSDEQEPGKSIDLPFTKTGTFDVLCEIHPKMLLRVTVE